jgi:hypothetical protein
VDRTKYQIQIPLPPKIDPTVTMMTVEEKPDVTYADIGAGVFRTATWHAGRYPLESLGMRLDANWLNCRKTQKPASLSNRHCRMPQAGARSRSSACGRWWSCRCCTPSALWRWASTRPRACCATARQVLAAVHSGVVHTCVTSCGLQRLAVPSNSTSCPLSAPA